jgi:hypothetical protein
MARLSRRQRVSKRNGNFCFVSKPVSPRANHEAIPVPPASTDRGVVRGSLGERPAHALAQDQLHRPGRRRGVLRPVQPRLARRFRYVPSWRPVANRVQERLGQMPSGNQQELVQAPSVGFDLWREMSMADGTPLSMSMALQFRNSSDPVKEGAKPLRHSTVHTRAGRDSKADLWVYVKRHEHEQFCPSLPRRINP